MGDVVQVPPGGARLRFEWTQAIVGWADAMMPVIRARMQSVAPVKTARFQRTIFFRRASRVGAVQMRFLSPEPYAPFIIHGTRPHDIFPRNASVLHFTTKDGSEVFTRQVHHPGTKPNDFAIRAWRLALPVVWAALETHIRKNVHLEAA